jgi:hypothetical protein
MSWFIWPGRGPFRYLPPWMRPGWLYGRGACWWLFRPYTWYGYTPSPFTSWYNPFWYMPWYRPIEPTPQYWWPYTWW